MQTLLQSVSPALQQAIVDSHLCQSLLDTHGQIWVSLFCDHCSFLLGPGVHKVLFMPSKSLFPQICVSSGGSLVELMATSSKRTYGIPKSAAPSLFSCGRPLLTHTSTETLTYSYGSVSVVSLGPGAYRFVGAFWASLGGKWFDSKCDFTPPTV